jgi:Icc-related predicted phosphoesterase
MIHLLTSRVTPQQLNEMLEELEDYVKLAVDIEQSIVAGGGELHADCEAVLMENGSRQENVWGADWIPAAREVRFESFINIRPRQNNTAMEIQDKEIRSRVEKIVREFFEEA